MELTKKKVKMTGKSLCNALENEYNKYAYLMKLIVINLDCSSKKTWAEVKSERERQMEKVCGWVGWGSEW